MRHLIGKETGDDISRQAHPLSIPGLDQNEILSLVEILLARKRRGSEGGSSTRVEESVGVSRIYYRGLHSSRFIRDGRRKLRSRGNPKLLHAA